MTGLRSVENLIERLEYKPQLSEVEWMLAFAPVLCASGIVHSCVNSGLRISTAIPTTIYDLACGIIFQDRDHFQDGLLTIPKAVVHLVVDCVILAASLALGLVIIAAVVYLLFQRLAEIIAEGIVSCLRPVGSSVVSIYNA